MNMNWNYIAGFFDGEGYTAARVGKDGCWKFVWQLTQKDTGVLDEIFSFLIECGLRPIMIPNKTKACASLRLYRVSDVEFVLKKLLPRIIVKRAAATEVLSIISKRPRKGDFWGGRPTKKGGKLSG